MNRLIKKAGILLGIFIAAVILYFIWEQRGPEKPEATVYTTMEEADLPIVYTTMFGREMNILHGYVQDMGQATARESLTILPQDRKLNIRIAGYGDAITGIHYEIRSLDLERLVERVSLSDWSAQKDGIHVALPIQNLLEKDSQYLLDISLDTQDHGAIHYYTRIMWTDNQNIKGMVDFALDFTNRTFDYNQAQALTTYLEPNEAEDNSSLGHVTIHSSFDQLTWAGLKMKLVGGIQATLKEVDGIMCNVQLNYQVGRTSDSGEEELYQVVDNFTLKWDPRRIYLMDFDRRTNQVFSGHRELFSGKRILLGITNDDQVAAKASPDGNYIAFVANRDLWSYDQAGKVAVKVFSFRSGSDDGIRSSYGQHGVKILSAADNGDMDFLVYGYMNRGVHEGGIGIAMYHFSREHDAIQERFYVPVKASYDEIKSQLDQLAYLGANGMLYLMVDHGVFGIDLNSNEYMVLADSLEDGSYAVSDSGKRLAWQEGGTLYGSHLIHLMDLDTGAKKEIKGPDNDLMRVLGFVGDDFIYGMAKEGDQWMENGRVQELPMYSLEIMGTDYKIEKHYQNLDSYLTDVQVEDGRIHLKKVTRLAGQKYAMSQGDTIVCNQEVGADPLKGIGWYASKDRRKAYFVQLDQEVKNSRSIQVTTPKSVVFDSTEVLNLKSSAPQKAMWFYAYGRGRLLGMSQTFSKAVAMAYEKMGFVADQSQKILWDRVNRSPIQYIKDPVMAAGEMTRYLDDFTSSGLYGDNKLLLLDARDCSLTQVLYFIGQGRPVVAYKGEGSYVLLYGYDQYNVSIYDPATRTASKMGLKDAGDYFQRLGNDFVAALSAK